MGDVFLSVALLVVLAILAVPVSGSLLTWKACGLYLPAGVHASALALGVLGLLSGTWFTGIGVFLLTYLFYAMFGSHRQRSLLDAERRARSAGQGGGSEPEKALARELHEFRACTRAQLIERLFEVTEKAVPASDGSSGRVRIEVLPQAYRWEGGNTTHFNRLRDAVRAGEGIKVLGLWVPDGQDFLQRRQRVSQGFRVDAEGVLREL